MSRQGRRVAKDPYALSPEEREAFVTAARSLLGPGYITAYYEDAASEFIAAAEWVMHKRVEWWEGRRARLLSAVQEAQAQVDQARAALEEFDRNETKEQ